MHSGVLAKLQLVRAIKRQPPREILLTRAPELAPEREQVAAVCYRIRKLKIELLLVRTRKGRWTFPKGGIVPGLTSAQSAALEAFEEAGVHGRIEEASFTDYLLRKGKTSQPATAIPTHAHLCEVWRLGPSQETGRSPTWFSPEKAAARLAEGRTSEDAGEFARVLRRAVCRIRRLAGGNQHSSDPMQKVQFEFSEKRAGQLIARVALLPCMASNQQGNARPAVIQFDAGSKKILRLGPAGTTQRLPR